MSSRVSSAEEPVLRLPFGRSLTAAAVIVLLTAGLVLAGIIVAVTDDDGAAGVARTSQSASASEAGVTLSSQSAVFSGTSTRLQIDVALDDTVGPLQQVSIPGDAIMLSGFQSSDAVRLPARLPLLSSERVDLTLPPIAQTGQPVVTIARIEIQAADGTVRPVAGSWSLPLTPPGERAVALRVETLTVAASDAVAVELMVEIVSAVRSRSETRVVLAAAWRGQPVLPAWRSAWYRPFGEISIDPWASGGNRTVLVLPPSPFGEPVFLAVDAWAIASAPVWTVLDLHPLVAAGGRGSLAPVNVLFDSGLPGTFSAAEIDDTVTVERFVGSVPVWEFEELFREHQLTLLVLPSGRLVSPTVAGTRRGRQGLEEFERVSLTHDFPDLDLSDLDGTVVLHHPLFASGAGSALPDRWAARLEPAEP